MKFCILRTFFRIADPLRKPRTPDRRQAYRGPAAPLLPLKIREGPQSALHPPQRDASLFPARGIHPARPGSDPHDDNRRRKRRALFSDRVDGIGHQHMQFRKNLLDGRRRQSLDQRDLQPQQHFDIGSHDISGELRLRKMEVIPVRIPPDAAKLTDQQLMATGVAALPVSLLAKEPIETTCDGRPIKIATAHDAQVAHATTPATAPDDFPGADGRRFRASVESGCRRSEWRTSRAPDRSRSTASQCHSGTFRNELPGWRTRSGPRNK